MLCTPALYYAGPQIVHFYRFFLFFVNSIAKSVTQSFSGFSYHVVEGGLATVTFHMLLYLRAIIHASLPPMVQISCNQNAITVTIKSSQVQTYHRLDQSLKERDSCSRRSSEESCSTRLCQFDLPLVIGLSLFVIYNALNLSDRLVYVLLN